MDPISTGLDLAIELRKQGMNLVRIFSRSFPASVVSHLQGSEALDWTSTIQHQDDDLERTLKLLRNLKLSFQACVPGCETGVRCADALAERLGLPGNGALTSDIRRNKYLMGEQLRRSGLRAAKQALVQDWTDVETFLETEGYGEEFQLIVKPLDSAASDGVNLCHSRAELRQSVEELLGELNALGTLNSGILVQEYLGGRELVVDSVSREGVHKIVALWEYEKHPANGKPFIYHSMRLLCSERDPDAADVCEYALRVLEALHVKQGPAHTEIKLTPHGPVLVELGARLHGGDGSFLPIPRICLGYTQVSATVAALLRPDDFLQLPDRPVLGDSTGAEVFLIVRQAGIVRDLPLLPKLRRELQSLVQENFTVTPGSRVSVTVDAMTVPGGIAIVTESPETLEREISKARQILDDPDFILLEEGLDVESELSLPSIAAPAAITNSSVHRSHPRQDSPPVQSSFSAKSLPGLETAIRSLRESGSTVDLGSVRRTLHTEAATPKGIVVVDPFSSGANLAAELSSRGVPVIQLHSARFSERIQDMVREDLDLEFVACLQHEGPPRDPEAIQRTLKLLQNLPLEIQAVIPGCETGVEVADALAAALQVRGNDPGLSEARRDKFCMGEQVRRHGLRAVRQARATRWTHVQAFLEELRGRGKQNGQNPLFSFPETAGMKNKTTQGSWGHGFRAVIKPVSSGGSDGVYLCTSEEELRTRFDQLLGEINMLGQRNKSLLVQEYLEGPEFVVDTVSKDGKHKCVAVWAYDKRPANGAEFVYFSMRLQEMTPQGLRGYLYFFFFPFIVLSSFIPSSFRSLSSSFCVSFLSWLSVCLTMVLWDGSFPSPKNCGLHVLCLGCTGDQQRSSAW